MTYEQVEKQVLKLLNQYTTAGYRVAETYNNQEDYLERIPALVNDALMEICTTVRKLHRTVLLSTLQDTGDTEDKGDEIWCEMPQSFYQFKPGEQLLSHKGRTFPIQWVRHYGGNHISTTYLIVPKRWLLPDDDLIVGFYRFPILFPEDRSEFTEGLREEELDGMPDTHRAIPYYVAGMLALHDDPFLASTLMNAYEDKLAKLAQPLVADVAPVQDAYSFYRYHEMY